MAEKNSVLKQLQFGTSPKSGKAENPLYKPIGKEENPKKITNGMRLVYVRGDFSQAVQGKTLHYSGFFNRILKPSLQKDLSTMAIFQRAEWLVICWVEES